MLGWGCALVTIAIVAIGLWVGGYWYIVVSFVAVVVVLWLTASVIWEKKEREEVEIARLKQLKRHRGEQERYRNELIVIGENSMGLFELITQSLRAAEEHFDKAEVDFADRAFAPFWDSIEEAAKALGRFDEGVRRINDNLRSYTALIERYEDAPPEFPLARQSVAKLGVSKATAERMNAIVRKAQRNWQFAMIYGQCKTNKILVAGFNNLAQALDGMTMQITDSIDCLASSVDRMSSSVDHMSSTLNESIQAIHEETSKEAERMDKALEMLDDIQRRRKRFP